MKRKLSPEAVRLISIQREKGESASFLARAFGVSLTTIYGIKVARRKKSEPTDQETGTWVVSGDTSCRFESMEINLNESKFEPSAIREMSVEINGERMPKDFKVSGIILPL